MLRAPPTAIMTSPVVFRVPPAFALFGFPNVKKEEKGLDLQFFCHCAKWTPLFVDIIFANINSEIVQNWVPNMVSKFQDDPTINESELIVLLKQV